MKKLLSMVMTAVLLASAVAFSAHAEEADTNYLFKDRYDKAYGDYLEWTDAEYCMYREVYYHYTDDGSIDWALINAFTNMVQPMECYGVFGNRVIYQYNMNVPFTFNYAVYDVAEDQFMELQSAWKNEKYEGLYEALDSLNIGKLLGDVNNDNVLNITDATIIQKCLAGLQDFPIDDEVSKLAHHLTDELSYLSDVNHDGQRTIADATALQYILAGI